MFHASELHMYMLIYSFFIGFYVCTLTVWNEFSSLKEQFVHSAMGDQRSMATVSLVKLLHLFFIHFVIDLQITDLM